MTDIYTLHISKTIECVCERENGVLQFVLVAGDRSDQQTSEKSFKIEVKFLFFYFSFLILFIVEFNKHLTFAWISFFFPRFSFVLAEMLCALNVMRASECSIYVLYVYRIFFFSLCVGDDWYETKKIKMLIHLNSLNHISHLI